MIFIESRLSISLKVSWKVITYSARFSLEYWLESSTLSYWPIWVAGIPNTVSIDMNNSIAYFGVKKRHKIIPKVSKTVWVLTIIECFHSRDQNLCKFIGTKESICIRREFNSHRIGLGHQHGRRFIVLGHQYGRRDVMWKHSITYRNQGCE